MSLYQNIIHNRTYARMKGSRLETYEETVDRYIDYLKTKTEDGFLLDEIEVCREMIKRQEIMPSMRLFYSAGVAVEAENAMAFNCKYQSIHSLKSFADLLYSLLCTCGVGISVQQEYVSQIPVLPDKITISNDNIVIEDNRTGWAEAFHLYLNVLFSSGCSLQFDVSKVRDKGSPLVVSGGYASGPEPLLKLRDFVENIAIKRQGGRLKSIDCFDIACMIAQCAVQGGVRRAAIITLFDDTDEEMLYAKSSEVLRENPHRYNSNNTMVWNGDPTILDKAFEQTKINGEPGILFKDNLEKKMDKLGRVSERGWGINPCVTGDTLILTMDGYQPIKKLVGKTVEIWNGFEWSEAVPFETGVNKIYEVGFNNFTKVYCTEYHKWHITTGIKTTVELTKEDTLIEFKIPAWLYHTRHNVRGIKPEYVKETGTAERTYCLNEPKNNTFIANGIITGNCGEIILKPNQLCNLTEVVLRPDDEFHLDMKKVRYATILGLLQATLTKYGFIDNETRYNQENDPIIGVSLTGLCDCEKYTTWSQCTYRLEMLKGVARNTTDALWELIGLEYNPKAITCIKPSGTVSQLVNSSSGIHPRYDKYYIRRVLIGSDSHLYEKLAKAGVPYLEFDCMDGRVFEFPMKSPDDSVVVDHVNAIQQLRYINDVNSIWCDHNASCTVYVKKNEWEAVKDVLKGEHSFISLSFLPYELSTDTTGFLYLPYEKTTKEDYEARKANEDKISWEMIIEGNGIEKPNHVVEFACAGGHCDI